MSATLFGHTGSLLHALRKDGVLNPPSTANRERARLDALGPLTAGENTVYPILRRLKSDRQLETFTAQSPAGPPRQYYRLTAQGRARLDTLEHEWQGMVAAVNRCFKMKEASWSSIRS